MFNKILIANRGEIAERILRTCNKMGITTVVIFSEADKEAPIIKKADSAYFIGESRVTESYGNIEKIIDIAKKSGADAIHPGYGFLSENPVFARRCKEEGITFIGPSEAVIEQMGSKIEARKAMEQIGVPIVPGVKYSLANEEEAIKAVREIGFPIMLKASAGGGGIGLQKLANEQEIRRAFKNSQQRAKELFADEAIYFEKYIEHARHIEIQILADQQGNTIYLGERECSIQRRHQKVIEEAPSPFIDNRTRIKMGELAVSASQAIGYTNAGTFEFLVDNDKKIYFLEMNTRLQVEHPITEEVTGIDLVEQQIRIAAGEALSYRQEDIKLHGHAIEVRIYAEDPKTFFPSPGKIHTLHLPIGSAIRHEYAVMKGSIVTPYYDPMIAKMIVKGKNRKEAIDYLVDALATYKIEGIKTNIAFLHEAVTHQAFIDGNTPTSFVYTFLDR